MKNTDYAFIRFYPYGRTFKTDRAGKTAFFNDSFNLITNLYCL